MKKGDVIQKEEVLPIGHVLCHNFSEQAKVKAWVEQEGAQSWGCIPAYDITSDPLNPTALCAMLISPLTIRTEARVNWVVGDDAAIQYKDGGCSIINLQEDKGWMVLISSAPSYQSSVEHMTVEQLQASIIALRDSRLTTPTRVKTRKTAAPKAEAIDKNDPMAVALSGMSEEKKLELMRKLGLVD